MRLAELQRAVQAHLLAGGTPAEELVAAIHPPGADRWRIYSDAYRIRLVDALAKGFPAIAARLGASTFGALMLDFVATHPSVHRSVRDYGGELEGWLRGEARDATGPELAMLADLAAFEWALAGAYDAADACAVTHADLARIEPDAWAELSFGPVPSVRRVVVRTNAVAIRAEVLREDAADDAERRGPAAERTAPAGWLIWRDGLDVRFRATDAAESEALDLCLSGIGFGALCEALAGAHGDEAPMRAATWLKGWTAAGLLIAR